MDKSLRIVFMGTPGFAVPALEALINSRHQVLAVVCSPDKIAGRGLQLSMPAVKKTALEHQIRILQPEKLQSSDFIEELKSLHADVFVVVAFRKLPKEVWSIPPMGTFNLHASLLPDYRGAAPIQRAIMNGETMSGLSTFLIDEQIDTGKILLRKEIPVNPDEDAGSLHDRMMIEGSRLILQSLELLISGEAGFLDQEQLITKGQIIRSAPKIHKEDCVLDLHRNAHDLHNQVRGLSPFPGAFIMLQDSEGKTRMLKIFRSSVVSDPKDSNNEDIISDARSFLHFRCREGLLSCIEVQAEGKRRMPVAEFLRGNSWILSAKACSDC
jgi:methionyl-tRNA formyltransferase